RRAPAVVLPHDPHRPRRVRRLRGDARRGRLRGRLLGAAARRSQAPGRDLSRPRPWRAGICGARAGGADLRDRTPLRDRRALPGGGAGLVEVLMTFALVWVGVPFAPALLGVLVYRLFNFWLPIVPALAVLPTVKSLYHDFRHAEQEFDEA